MKRERFSAATVGAMAWALYEAWAPEAQRLGMAGVPAKSFGEFTEVNRACALAVARVALRFGARLPAKKKGRARS